MFINYLSFLAKDCRDFSEALKAGAELLSLNMPGQFPAPYFPFSIYEHFLFFILTIFNKSRKKETLMGMTRLPEPRLHKHGANREGKVYKV
jgi:hypothetical protein